MDFFSLEPEEIISAAESLGFSCTGHIQQLNSMENRVFDLRLEDGSHLISKFYRPGRWNREAIEDEHRFLAHLISSEIPVCAPLERDGVSLFEARGLYFALWQRTGGRLIDEFNHGILRRIGGYLARIHVAGRGISLDHRPRMDGAFMVARHRDYLHEQNLLPDALAGRYDELSAYLELSAANLEKQSAYQPIHGDCHTGNMLLGDGGLFFLDFDDAMTGPPIQDMWMVVSDSAEAQDRKTAAFLEGYEQFAAFPMESIRFRELMRALRYIAYNGWIARRRDDPAVSRAFPDFGSREYWEGFILDLEDQIDQIERDSGYQAGGSAPQPAVQGPDEPELSDEDYFFDLDDGRWTPGQQ
jgi:Ser/Thr protein kinase RdoA (MazF antagonist)